MIQRRIRGAAMVEYAFLLICVMGAAGGAVKGMHGKTAATAIKVASTLTGGGGGGASASTGIGAIGGGAATPAKGGGGGAATPAKGTIGGTKATAPKKGPTKLEPPKSDADDDADDQS